MARAGSWELLGYDFVVDERMHVWLLEVNASPRWVPFSCGATNCQSMLQDVHTASHLTGRDTTVQRPAHDDALMVAALKGDVRGCSLEHSTPVTAAMVPAMIEGLFKVR